MDQYYFYCGFRGCNDGEKVLRRKKTLLPDNADESQCTLADQDNGGDQDSTNNSTFHEYIDDGQDETASVMK